jgi:hypothetical protein
MGEEYVRRAVRMGEGRLAAEFWRMLVKDRMPWTTEESIGLRRAIAEAVAAQGRDGRLRAREMQALVGELGFGTWTANKIIGGES